MDTYEIIMTPDATIDLIELRNYIADVLFAPDTALNYIRRIRRKINTLDQPPHRAAPVSNEPWRSHGIRKITADNFYIYFRIDENSKRVYILNIIYSKRDQLKMLADITIDEIPPVSS